MSRKAKTAGADAAPPMDRRDVKVGHDVIFLPRIESEYLAHYGFPSGQRFRVVGTMKPGQNFRTMLIQWPGSEVTIAAKRAHLRRVEEIPKTEEPAAPAEGPTP